MKRVMEDLEEPIFDSVELELKGHIGIIDDIIQIQRRKDNSNFEKDITKEERDIILKQALGTYKLLNETIVHRNGKVLIEYRRGLHKIVEEVILENV